MVNAHFSVPVPCWCMKLSKRHFDGIFVVGWGADGEEHWEHDAVDAHASLLVCQRPACVVSGC